MLRGDVHVKTDWKFDNGNIIASNSRAKERNTRSSESMKLELMILNASTVDSGRYTCDVSSTGGDKSKGIYLYVVSKGEK